MTRKARSAGEIESKREEILGRALDIISKGGYDDLTMRDLASRVGMTSTNLYNYFSSKDELYLQLVIKGFRELRERLEAAFMKHSDPVKRARTVMEAYFRFGLEEGHYYDIMFTLPMPRYRDYLGTGLQETAQVEMDLSNELVARGLLLVSQVTPGLSVKERRRRLLHIWSLLHGIISLARSQVLQYVEEDIQGLFRGLVADFLKR